MDAEFRAYLKAAHGAEPPASAADPRWAETEALARRLIASAQAEPALKALAQESPATRKHWDVLLLAGLLHLGLGERAAALEPLEVVADKLLAAEDRDGIVALLPHFLHPDPVSAAVRLLHHLARHAADDDERIGHLHQALAVRPLAPELHAELAQALERTGDGDGARDHRLRGAELYLEAGRPEAVGEDLLRAVEEDLPHHPARVGRLLLHHAALAPWSEAEPLLELALAELEARAHGHIAWAHIAPAAAHAPATRAVRALFARLLRVVVAREPEPDAVVAGSGILDPVLSVEEVGARLGRILTLPPGTHVAHTAWGMGRVVANDGESVTLAFRGKEGHRMTLAMAARALERLPGGGLRVLAATDPERLRTMAEAGDTGLVVAALHDMAGQGSVAQLKQRLEGHLAGADWAGWWKDAKERIKQDRRLDGREAYRQIYRLAVELEDGTGADAGPAVALPELSPRRGGQGLGLLRQFLKEHPDQEERVREAAATAVAAWARDAKLEPGQRAQALAHLVGWGSLPRDAAQALLGGLIGLGLAADDVNVAQTQELLLDLAEGSPAEADFAWRAVESRLPRLRERGRARLRAILGQEGFARAVEQRITRPGTAAGAAARLVVHYAEHPEDQGAPSREALLLAAVRLVERERDLEPRHVESLLGLLAEAGPLTRAFRAAAPGAETLEALEQTALHWQGSERRLHPVLDFLVAIGDEGILRAYEARRSARVSSLAAGRHFDDLETNHTVMSRATYSRLEEEAKRLGLELKTSIPAAIDRARQLGDLRENAEYEAAKQRQANAAARLQSLMDVLARARLLETIEVDPSRAGIGTEVELEPLGGGERVRYWILGEGDNALGPGIVSYRAPIVKPLLGRPVGAEVQLPSGDGEQAFRITSIVKRLPGP
jgi:transcription elongation factor GreA